MDFWQFLCDYEMISLLLPQIRHFLPKSQFSVIIYFFTIYTFRPLKNTEKFQFSTKLVSLPNRVFLFYSIFWPKKQIFTVNIKSQKIVTVKPKFEWVKIRPCTMKLGHSP